MRPGFAEPSSLREQNPALAHIIDVENDIVKAADRLRPRGGMREFRTAFPAGAFGTSVKTAMQVLAACEASGSVRRMVSRCCA